MELDELHILELGPGAERHAHSIAGGHSWIGRFPIHLPQSARGEKHSARMQVTHLAGVIHERNSRDPTITDA